MRQSSCYDLHHASVYHGHIYINSQRKDTKSYRDKPVSFSIEMQRYLKAFWFMSHPKRAQSWHIQKSVRHSHGAKRAHAASIRPSDASTLPSSNISPLIQSVEVKPSKNTGYRPNSFVIYSHSNPPVEKTPNVLPRRRICKSKEWKN